MHGQELPLRRRAVSYINKSGELNAVVLNAKTSRELNKKIVDLLENEGVLHIQDIVDYRIRLTQEPEKKVKVK